ncbi:MAG: sulfatase [Bacteroidales bacterium]
MKVPLLFAALALPVCFSLSSCTSKEDPPPNVVIVFLDDSGWADFEPFGATHHLTPNVAQLAREGTAFHNFYVPQAVCSASRAALLSGCYPGRTKVFSAHGPGDLGLDTTFATLGEVFLKAGYATAAFGKWHIGDRPETRPQARGFQETSGLMYSNDMWKHHPEHPEYWGQWPLQYWENGEVTIADVEPADQKKLTRWYTEHAVDFIHRHQKEPFLLYLAHSMPHVPLYVGEAFEGRSGKGRYADVIAELDWSLGEVTRALRENGLEDNTLLILTSDNGPWTSYGDHAGFTPYREAKGTSFDGGVRSACLVKYPGQVPDGLVSDKAWGSVDILPTLCALAGVPLPANPIDGMDVWDLIRGVPEAENPHPYYAFSNNSDFEGIMSGDGRWKLHLPHAYRFLDSAGSGGGAGRYGQAFIDTALYHLSEDPFETVNVLREYPDIAARLLRLAEEHKHRFYEE